MVSMVLVPYGINPNFDIVPRVMVTSLRFNFFQKKDEKNIFNKKRELKSEKQELNEENIKVNDFGKAYKNAKA
ncbi:hypothetical protein BpHYR1_014902 [Brachionus plicatilis]|uniref:Uncharacterized protein n=1 Tax=Brachionus plicatilis TaxID=10195 RepID=A0A3M7R8X9_BRAPC|nr:hypothetical protein BpHYR1_014902 [Brachionus plicatilis]